MPRQLVVRPAPPPRGLLWGAAVRMWSARPLLGIGPDVFRHAYGPELGLWIWDDRLHTNSLYLELLVGTGVAGLVAFLLLIAQALWRAARVLAPIRTKDEGRWTKDDGLATAPLSSIIDRRSSVDTVVGGDHNRQKWMALGCAVALLTFLVHGVLDMFLEYSATNLLLWALIGALGGLAASGGSGDRPEHIQ
jgi:O-antigen ligase